MRIEKILYSNTKIHRTLKFLESLKSFGFWCTQEYNSWYLACSGTWFPTFWCAQKQTFLTKEKENGKNFVFKKRKGEGQNNVGGRE